MQFILFIATVVLLLATAQGNDETNFDLKTFIKESRAHCLEETKVPLERVEEFNQYQYDDEDGNFQKEGVRSTMIELMGEEKAAKVISECLIKDGNITETVWKYAKCCRKYWTSSYPLV